MSFTTRLDALLSAATDRIPGVVAIVADRSGTRYEGAFGVRDRATGTPMTIDTLFGLASMTKAIASAGAMQLVEQGSLSLDGNIADVLPALAAPQVLTGFTADGTPQLRPANGPITLRQLLSHSAGFGYDTWNPEIRRYLAALGLPRVPTSHEQLARMPLLSDPGTRWNYSIATDVAGKAVEAVVGQRLDHHLRTALLDPLGMPDTTVDLSADQAARLARVHQRGADGQLTPIDFMPGDPARWCIGGGALRGTARDYTRFLRMVLNGGTLDGIRVLGPAALADMSRNQLPPGQFVTCMRSVVPERSNDAEFFPGLRKGWTTAFMTNEDQAPTGRPAGSLAWAGIANTYCWADPTNGIAGVFLTQVMPFADIDALGLFTAFETEVYASLGK